MSTINPSWKSIASQLKAAAAHHLAELLQAELIPTRVVNVTASGASENSGWDVQVPPEQVGLAQRLIASSHVTDAERTLLASQRGADDGKKL